MRENLFCLVTLSFALSPASAQTDPHGFIQDWLILGPYAREGGDAPGTELISADYLTDGITLEEIVVPAEHDTVATAYGIAQSTELLGGGVPQWIAWRDADDGINLNDDVYGPRFEDPNDCMAYACCYVENATGLDQAVVVALASDDSVEVLVGIETVLTLSVARPWGAKREIQNRFPVTLPPGKSRILVKIFEGEGEWGFRLRLETPGGNAITAGTPGFGFSLDPGSLVYPARIMRELPEAGFRDDPAAIVLSVAIFEENTIARVREVVPAGWIVDDPGTGTVGEGGSITWEVTERADLTYTARNTGMSGGRWEGTFQVGARTFPVQGDRYAGGGWVDKEGFIRHWLILGPLDRAGGGEPASYALAADYLTDGVAVWEDTVLPEEGQWIDVSFCGAAASSGLALNGAGIVEPHWRAHVDGDDTICFEGDTSLDQAWYFDPSNAVAIDDFMAYAAVYVENPTGESIVTNIGLARDESAAVLVNTRRVFSSRESDHYGPGGTVRDVIAQVRLEPGTNRLLVKIFDGIGASGFRLRFQDEQGDPVFFPVAASPGGLSFPVRVIRHLPPQFIPGDTVQIDLEITLLATPAPATLSIVEVVPPGWVVAERGGGVLSGNVLTWTATPPVTETKSYTLIVPHDFQDASFSGSWSTSAKKQYIGGDEKVPEGVPEAVLPSFFAHGFITDWLILGPLAVPACSSVHDFCGGGGEEPCCSAPGDQAILEDYLTDGTVTEDVIRPYPGMIVATDFSRAAASGLLAVPNPAINPTGVPQWFRWHAADGFVDLDAGAFGSGDLCGCMAYAAVYVHNETAADLDAFIAVGSDDSPVIFLNGAVVHAENIEPDGRAYGGTPEYQDLIGPVTLHTGENRLLLKIFQGWGEWSFALRFQDEGGVPITEGLRIGHISEARHPGALVRRELPLAASWGQIVTVKLQGDVEPGNEITIVEHVPPGWSVSGDPDGGGVVEANHITWTGITEPVSLQYQARSNGSVRDGVFSGSVTGTVSMAVVGDVRVVPRIQPGGVGSPWRVANVGAAWGVVEGLNGEGGDDHGFDFNVWTKGRDIWDQHDQFTFLYREIAGDFTIMARVDAFRASHPWGKAGIMVRSDLCSNDPYTYLCVTPEKGIDWQRRTRRGRFARNEPRLGDVAAPQYLLLTGFQGETLNLAAAYSRDGHVWTVHSMDEPNELVHGFYLGIATSSHDTELPGAASYRSVRFMDRAVVPPQDLICTHGGGVQLTWRNPVPYDAIDVFRIGPDGQELIESLPGNETFSVDDDVPNGSLLYRVVGSVEGVGLYAECGVDAGAPYRVNCAGRPYVDTTGRAWIEDQAFVVKPEHTQSFFDGTAVANTEDDLLYFSWRSRSEGGRSLAYRFPLSNGRYTVELHFDESCPACTAAIGPDGVWDSEDDGGFGRTFDVLIEGKTELGGFRPAIEASAESGMALPGGEAFTAIVKSVVVDVADSELAIEFLDLGPGNPPHDPLISAIAVYEHGERIYVFTGDANGDGQVDIADGIYLLSWLFGGGPDLPCAKAGDANNDDRLDIGDAITILAYLFQDGFLVHPDGLRLETGLSTCKEYVITEPWALDCATPCIP